VPIINTFGFDLGSEIALIAIFSDDINIIVGLADIVCLDDIFVFELPQCL
jgi:hypothetical protein